MKQEVSHKDMVAKLVKSGETIVNEMTSSNAHLLHMSMGISGESGELLDAIKKAVFYCNPLDIVNVIEELGDIEFYMEGLRQELGITRDETIQANINKLGVRYKGYNYTDQQAKDRNDKLTSDND